jgi:hypothetical protein
MLVDEFPLYRSFQASVFSEKKQKDRSARRPRTLGKKLFDDQPDLELEGISFNLKEAKSIVEGLNLPASQASQLTSLLQVTIAYHLECGMDVLIVMCS